MHVLSLPYEVILHITSDLPHATLVNISLVCKTWRSAILSILFNSIALTNDGKIAHFSNTITSDNGSSSISQCIRSLSITTDPINKSMTEQGLALLAPCVPHLSRLVQLRWRIFFAPVDVNVLKLFQTSCPQLRSVTLLVPNGYKFKNNLEEYQYATLLGFKNLSEFRIQVHHITPDIGTEAFGPLKGLIANCPKLELLQLYFLNLHPRPVEYTPENVAIWLGLELNMSSLRSLQLLGSLQIDEGSLVSPLDTGTYYFRDFLARHAHIEELFLTCVDMHGFLGTANPEDLAQLLPSLKRFSGPDFLCDLLVRSSVAKQLECLSIDESAFKAGMSFTPHRPYSVLPLPMLRELVIETEIYYQVLTMLELLLPGAPGLERLGLAPMPPPCHAMLLELVSNTPKLRQTSIFNFTPSLTDPTVPYQKTSGDIAQHQLFDKIKRVCPELEVTGSWLGSMTLEKCEAGIIW
ncbi:unnamed protein product [Rhizoctonia solani]|uniref:F-box domain-containing protein n=1 Tax=Rhizoctonia solani TaxID=456999 RepID=A0A8H3H8L9_9AGAM|nr:unnamed protein product [Rhizoctonia solani]